MTANGTQTYRWAAEILYKVYQHGIGAGDRHAMGAGDRHAMGALNKQLQLVDEQLTPGK